MKVFSSDIKFNTPTSSAMQFTAADLAFLLEQIGGEKEKGLKEMEIASKSSGFPIQVAIIDVSGSMGGGKLEAVKHALVQNIHQITAEAPKTQFILLPFHSDLDIYPNPSKNIRIADGPIMFKEEDLKMEAAKIIESNALTTLEKTFTDWTGIVKKMTALSMTALGPALFMGINLLIAKEKFQAQKTGGKVLLLTDGMANVGLGALENDKALDGKNAGFYPHVAQICLENKVIVDIVAVRDQNGGNSVALNIIGKVTDYTGGQMLFITADQIEKAFGDLTKTNYVAKNVILRVYSPESLEIEEIQGADLLQALPKKSGEPIRLGAFYPDREIYLKFKQTKMVAPSKIIPVQIKLEYEDAQNLHRVRLIQKEISLGKNLDEFKSQYDAGVATAYELSKASKLKAGGETKAAEQQAKMTIQRNISFGAKYSQDVTQLNALVNDEKAEWDADDKEATEQNIGDKASFYAAKGQARSRGSMDMKMKRMDKKKKE